MEKNYANKFNPYLPGIYPYIESRFSSYGYKCLKLLSITEPAFLSPNTKIITGLRSRFECLKQSHNSIEIGCSCGFYSFKRLEDAWDYSLFSPGSLIFKVKLLGDVIEHNIGYRSESQEVVNLYHSLCLYKKCLKEATVVSWQDSFTLSCLKHAGNHQVPLTHISKLGISLVKI